MKLKGKREKKTNNENSFNLIDSISCRLTNRERRAIVRGYNQKLKRIKYGIRK